MRSSENMKLPLLLVGVGNPMYGDDAIGYCIARALEECLSMNSREHIKVIAKPTLTIADAALLGEAAKTVIIDSAEGLESEYRLYKITGSEEELAEYSRPLDSHSVSPINIVAVARSAGVSVGDVYLLLVKPSRISFGEGLSREAAERALRALRFLCNRITSVECRPDHDCVEEKLGECIGNPLVGL